VLYFLRPFDVIYARHTTYRGWCVVVLAKLVNPPTLGTAWTTSSSSITRTTKFVQISINCSCNRSTCCTDIFLYVQVFIYSFWEPWTQVSLFAVYWCMCMQTDLTESPMASILWLPLIFSCATLILYLLALNAPSISSTSSCARNE